MNFAVKLVTMEDAFKLALSTALEDEEYSEEYLLNYLPEDIFGNWYIVKDIDNNEFILENDYSIPPYFIERLKLLEDDYNEVVIES